MKRGFSSDFSDFHVNDRMSMEMRRCIRTQGWYLFIDKEEIQVGLKS